MTTNKKEYSDAVQMYNAAVALSNLCLIRSKNGRSRCTGCPHHMYVSEPDSCYLSSDCKSTPKDWFLHWLCKHDLIEALQVYQGDNESIELSPEVAHKITEGQKKYTGDTTPVIGLAVEIDPVTSDPKVMVTYSMDVVREATDSSFIAEICRKLGIIEDT